ncbi:MAG: DUF72 domain-containing protein [Acidobacteria bacterium]|nr:DUF72 domain-containing protein [Acidobacteriota bacterium]
MPDQIHLFDPDVGPHKRRSRGTAWPSPGSALDQRYERYRVLATSLPPQLMMGTSSWSFPGWQGMVWARKRSTSVLAKEGLHEYAQHPLLRTVGIDRSYYAAIPDDDLQRYAEQLPDGFPCCAKAPAAVTSPTIPGLNRHQPNPDFLSVERFVREVLDPFSRCFSRHAGPFILQFSPPSNTHATEASAFLEGLDRMLGELPRDFRYAVEIRDKWALTSAYRDVLARHGAAHVYNYWSAMPMPGAQVRTMPPEEQPFVMVRLLLRPGTWYEDQKQVFAPFDTLVEPDDEMRRDVLDIIRRAATGGRQTYVLVNNKAEGSAPLTIEALAERFVAESHNPRPK